ncbi:MAG TPA: amino acid permease, partial [Deltaproteobacteria bacterium]|nr:amino acid permease [Deltaproteobacteria bacterium]
MSEPDPSGTKAFGLWSAVFLGVGSMVGAGIFIVIGEAGAIAGNLVSVSFLLGGAIALVCGYSLSRLAIRYPSRGGIIEYLVQGYGEGFLSGTFGIVFYFAQLVSIGAVAKSFGTYAATWSTTTASGHIDLLALGILGFFVAINLAGAAVVARAENLIVVFKLAALALFTIVALLYIDPSRLSIEEAPGALDILSALGLTFFAYQGFSVITNAVEDMASPGRTVLRAMFLSIGLVGVLYVAVSIAVFGNLPLQEIIRDRDFALAEAARPAFGDWGFRIIAA